jgi:pimeloyl-ACP methyl ester carboxylesterase
MGESFKGGLCPPFFLASLMLALSVTAAAEVETYEFGAWAGPALEVRLFVPDDAAPDTPIAIVIHGWSREAGRYFDDWSALGEKHDFIVAVPHFKVEDFPGSNDFNQGHVFDSETAQMRPPEEWTFAVIEPLFDAVVERTGSEVSAYTLFGHSAGSQFVHRFLYYVPDARVKRYLAANAGWYTLPDFDIAYPYGLSDSGVTEAQLVEALEKDVVLLLGREDVDRSDPDLRKTPEADAQGPNRFARGLTIFECAQKAAGELGADFGWQLEIVDGAAHSNAQMAEAAAELVE